MAEYVEQSVEEMLGELEEMSRLGLFTDQERRIILKKRKAFEYKLRRKTKEREDYLQYIQYEINLLALVTNRSQQLRGGSQFKSIQMVIVQRILKLFWLASTRFQNDETMWLSYIEFTKKQGHKAQVTRIITDMLKILNRNPKLWVMAASWEFESCNNPTSARTLLQRGLRFNPESQLLWIEYYKMELMLTQKVQRLRKNDPEKKLDVSDAIVSGKVAEVVFKNAVDAFNGDVAFVIQLLRVCEMFDWTQGQQDDIVTRIRAEFSDKEESWDMLARRYLNSQQQQVTSATLRECHRMFGEAVTHLPTERMWTLYLQFCAELVDLTSTKPERNMAIQTMLQLYRRAADGQCLSNALYITWVESLLKIGELDEAQKESMRGVTQFPHDASLWQQRLRLEVCQKAEEASIMKVFKKARKAVPVKASWAVWRLVLEHLLSINSPDLIPLLEEGTSCAVRELCEPVKEWYMQWYTLSHSATESSHLYKHLTQKSSTSLQFFYNHINFEISQAKPKMLKVRKVYEVAIRSYGTCNVDIWLDYMALEAARGDVVNVGAIYQRAIRELNEQLVEEFVTRHTLSSHSTAEAL